MQSYLLIAVLSMILFSFVVLLIIESSQHHKRLSSIPLRISVSGTRGKTSVVRILARILQESGKVVLAKTTGTEAKYILPDQSEEPVKRFGPANIIEQKRLVKKAASLSADCIICEIMSIQAENHWIESHKLLRPNYTIFTNFLPDHLENPDRDSMINLYQNDIVRGATVLSEKEMAGGELESYAKGKGAKLIHFEKKSLPEQNAAIARAMAEELGIPNDTIIKGISESKMDKGKAYGFLFSEGNKQIVFVNGFSANDPESSKMLINHVRRNPDYAAYDHFGLMAFRNDRGERSKQWLDYLNIRSDIEFDKLFYLGSHGRIFQKKLGTGEVIKMADHEATTRYLIRQCSGSTLIFGLVNIGGHGLGLIDFWEKSGTKIDMLN